MGGWGKPPAVTTNGDHPDPLELLTITELSKLLKRSRASLYEDIAAGKLRTVKLGRTTRVPRVEAERYVYENGSPPAE